MKICVGIPVITGADHCKRAIDSVLNQEGVELLIIDNNADAEVKSMLVQYMSLANVLIIVNPVNVYVNPAWNQIIEHFLKVSDSDHLVVMNSDIQMQNDWANVCRCRFYLRSDEILIPRTLELSPLPYKVDVTLQNHRLVRIGVPGFFFTLNRTQAKEIFPIDDRIRCWFGDNFIFERLRKSCNETIVPDNLLCIHSWSSSVSVVPGVSDIIEQDKIAWETVKHLV